VEEDLASDVLMGWKEMRPWMMMMRLLGTIESFVVSVHPMIFCIPI
jgi:hypothetical protein